ncbi:AAA family ATPase [Leifsonia sp. 22587]|uniref:AAA family ATPase n=1 Tax=Leifsonia sp. 22587 TaxID=3453946 RepID=UPI003F8591B1
MTDPTTLRPDPRQGLTAAAANQTVIFVVGRPASGKSTLSRIISERRHLPIVAKDDIKERLFDTLGVGDVQWSERLGRASFALLDYSIELLLQSGASFIVDAAYNPAYEDAKVQAWQQRYGFTAIQVHCTASPDELTRRFIRREQDGNRHPGHADGQRAEQFRATLGNDAREALAVDGPLLAYDTEDETALAPLLARLDELLSEPDKQEAEQ